MLIQLIVVGSLVTITLLYMRWLKEDIGRRVNRVFKLATEGKTDEARKELHDLEEMTGVRLME